VPPTLQIIKSCCGSSAIIVNAEKPIRKEHIDFFKSKGFNVNNMYATNGLFLATKRELTISCAFGLTKINVRCKTECTSDINDLVSILTEIENT
jgi:hypothetical protein